MEDKEYLSYLIKNSDNKEISQILSKYFDCNIDFNELKESIYHIKNKSVMTHKNWIKLKNISNI